MNAKFGRLWASGALSSLGEGVTMIAGPLVAASITRDPVQIAGLTAAQQLPSLLFVLLAGAVADRTGRARLMTRAALVRFAVLSVLGLTVIAGQPSLPLLYAAFFIAGCAATVYDNATAALLPALVPLMYLDKANGRMLAAQTMCLSFIAPPLAGWLFGAVPGAPFLVDAAAFALVPMLVSSLREAPSIAVRTSIRRDIAEGARYLSGHRVLRALAVSVGMMNLGLTATMSILVLVAKERFGVGPVGYGLLFSALAAGGVVGGLVTAPVVRRLGSGGVVRLVMMVDVVTFVSLALTRDAVVAAGALAVFGMHSMMFSAANATLRQSQTPDRLRARVHSAHRLLSTAGALSGALLGGVLASSFTVVTPLWCAAASTSVLAACTWRTWRTLVPQPPVAEVRRQESRL